MMTLQLALPCLALPCPWPNLFFQAKSEKVGAYLLTYLLLGGSCLPVRVHVLYLAFAYRYPLRASNSRLFHVSRGVAVGVAVHATCTPHRRWHNNQKRTAGRMARLTLVALTSVLIAAQQSEEKPAEPKHKTWVEGGFTCIEVKFSHEDKTPNKACFGNFLDKEAEVDHNPFHAEKTCFNWCSLEPCLTLTGNRTQECGACGPAAKCHPAAEDWLKIKPTVKADERCEAYCEGTNALTSKGTLLSSARPARESTSASRGATTLTITSSARSWPGSNKRVAMSSNSRVATWRLAGTVAHPSPSAQAACPVLGALLGAARRPSRYPPRKLVRNSLSLMIASSWDRCWAV